MTPNATVCSAWRLYVILDPAAARARDLADLAAAAIRGGADVLQLRDKAASDADLLAAARRVVPIAHGQGIPLIVNDRVHIARDAGADGVHLGQEDVPLRVARTLLGPAVILGKSTHSLEQALAAQEEGADYLGCGPVFATPTKPDSPGVGLEPVTRVMSAVQVPVVCIGGIDERTLPAVLAAGARAVAVVRAVCSADDPESAARGLADVLRQRSRATAAPSV